MDRDEMRTVLLDHMDSLRQRTYSDLVAWLQEKHVDGAEVEGASGATYQIEVCFFWDDLPQGHVRIAGDIDEIPPRRLWGFLPIYVSPVTDSFIMRPDGSFVDE